MTAYRRNGCLICRAAGLFSLVAMLALWFPESTLATNCAPRQSSATSEAGTIKLSYNQGSSAQFQTTQQAASRCDLEDGFLWLDIDGNRAVNNGAELFGNATLLPDGATACNGFEALAIYDLPEHGGTADGRISPHDRIYSRLQVWVDRNHNAKIDGDETYTLRQLGVQMISLNYQESDEVDGNMNKHRFKSTYSRRLVHRNRPLLRHLAVHDVFFETGLTTPPSRQ